MALYLTRALRSAQLKNTGPNFGPCQDPFCDPKPEKYVNLCCRLQKRGLSYLAGEFSVAFLPLGFFPPPLFFFFSPNGPIQSVKWQSSHWRASSPVFILPCLKEICWVVGLAHHDGAVRCSREGKWKKQLRRCLGIRKSDSRMKTDRTVRSESSREEWRVLCVCGSFFFFFFLEYKSSAAYHSKICFVAFYFLLSGRPHRACSEEHFH